MAINVNLSIVEYDFSILDRNQLDDIRADFKRLLNHVNRVLDLIDKCQTIECGPVFKARMEELRLQTHHNLQAIQDEIGRREREQNAQRQKRATITISAPTTRPN